MTLRQGAGFAAVFAAVIVLARFRVAGLNLNGEIRVVELATLLVTVFIAVFVTSQLSDRRAEKDMLVSNVRDALDALRLCRERWTAGLETDKRSKKEAGRQVVRAVRQLSNAIEASETAVGMSVCSGLGPEYVEIRRHYYSYKMTVTGDASFFSDEERCYRALHASLQRLLFHINRHR